MACTITREAPDPAKSSERRTMRADRGGLHRGLFSAHARGDPCLAPPTLSYRRVSMRKIGLASTFIIAFAVACSDDDAGDGAVSQTNPNQPAATGSAGSAGSGGGGSAGTGATTAGSGGSSAEGSDDDIDLDEPSSDDGNSGSDGEVADASAPPAEPDAGGGDDDDEDDEDDTSMSFFVTSRGGPDGANFGGLAGADALCTTLAAAVSPELGAKTWRAYLSTSTVDARDRIGTGPWRNAAGVIIANDVDQLVDQGRSEEHTSELQSQSNLV